MSDRMPTHSAAQSAAGYLYQARLALAESLRFAYVDSAVEIAIEKLDDVSFEKDGDPLALLQTKHHLRRVGDLTDASVDFWKTLRVWAEQTKSDPSLPERTRFLLITTAQAPKGSAASYLRASAPSERNSEKAETLLFEAATAIRNEALRKAVDAFTSLMSAIRQKLVGAIEIVDGSPLISDLGTIIEDRLRMLAPSGKAPLAREQLEGWWWPRICAALQAESPETISVLEIEQKLDDIRDCLKRDALPLDMANAEPPESELNRFEKMQFVRQLEKIGIGSVRVRNAKRDFYRASTQRSRWARQNLVLDGELGRFEQILIEEWEPRFAAMCEMLDQHNDPGLALKEARKLYLWVESDARFPMRAMTSRFLTVGSYQILANVLRVGWHRDYEELRAKGPSDDR